MAKRFTGAIAPTRPLIQQKSSGMSVLITGAAKPHRMSSFGAKPLFNIGNTPIIDIVIPELRYLFPNSEVILTVGYEADKLIKKFSSSIKIIENQNFETTNLVEEIRLAINSVTNDRLLIIDADLLFNRSFFDKVKLDNSIIFVDESEQMSSDEVGVIISEGIVTNFSFGLPTKWCNVAYICNKELDLLRDIVADRKNSNLYFFEVLNTLINRGGKLKPMIVNEGKIKKIWSAKELRNENTNKS